MVELLLVIEVKSVPVLILHAGDKLLVKPANITEYCGFPNFLSNT